MADKPEPERQQGLDGTAFSPRIFRVEEVLSHGIESKIEFVQNYGMPETSDRMIGPVKKSPPLPAEAAYGAYAIHPRSARSARCGFTLIELLVVIAIIAILASILLPVIGRVRIKARTTQCANNLSNIGKAMEMYVSDNGRLPLFVTIFPLIPDTRPGGNPNRLVPVNFVKPGAPLGKKWYDDLTPYMSANWSNGVMRCPTYTGSYSLGKFVTNSQGLVVTVEVNLGSYGYNVGSADATDALLYGLGNRFVSGAAFTGEGTKEGSLRSPADMIAVADAFSASPYATNVIVEGFELLSRKVHRSAELGRFDKGLGPVRSRHAGVLNVTFSDGHVQALPYEKLLISRDPADLRRWHSDNEPHLELFR